MFKETYTMDRCTIASGKLAVIAFVLVVLKLWSAAMTWVHNTNIWWFVAALVIFAIKPIASMDGCCKSAKKKK